MGEFRRSNLVGDFVIHGIGSIGIPSLENFLMSPVSGPTTLDNRRAIGTRMDGGGGGGAERRSSSGVNRTS